MAFRFWRRVSIAPGLTLNLSKRGLSLSAGRRGARFTTGTHGERATFGIPGTGLFYTEKLSPKAARGPRGEGRRPRPFTPPPGPEDRLDLGFFRRLVTPPEERAFVDGLREVFRGNDDRARSCLQKVSHLADGAATLGLLLTADATATEEALKRLAYAVKHKDELGRCYRKYGVTLDVHLSVTEDVTARVEPDLRGVLLGLTELHQRRKQWREAIAALTRLRRLEPDDPVLALSFVELAEAALPQSRKRCEEILTVCKDVQNDSVVHAALLMYKGKALRQLGLPDEARAVFNLALRRRKDRPPDLLRAIRYERGLLYEEMGDPKRARSDFEKIYADDPEYEDVAKRLGL